MPDHERRYGNVARPLTLRCHGLRVTTNDRLDPPLDATVWDQNGSRLAGPFSELEDAVAWARTYRLHHPGSKAL